LSLIEQKPTNQDLITISNDQVVFDVNSTKENSPPPLSLIEQKPTNQDLITPIPTISNDQVGNSIKENSPPPLSSPLNSNDQIVNTTENPPSSLIKKKRKRQRHFGNK